MLAFSGLKVAAQNSKPYKNGSYTFKIYDTEYSKYIGTARVVIKNDSVYVIADGSFLTKGKVITMGIIVKQKKSTEFFIARNKKELNYNGPIGDCDLSSPSGIDFVKKAIIRCWLTAISCGNSSNWSAIGLNL